MHYAVQESRIDTIDGISLESVVEAQDIEYGVGFVIEF